MGYTHYLIFLIQKRAILEYRAAGDELFKTRMENAKKHANYTSGRIQNELIECIGRLTLQNIIDNVKRSEFYSIGFDETTDVAKSEQMAITLRYWDSENGTLREDLVSMVDCFAELKKKIKKINSLHLKGKILLALFKILCNHKVWTPRRWLALLLTEHLS